MRWRRAITCLLLVGLSLGAAGCGGSGTHVLSSSGIRVAVPNGWRLVRPSPDGPISDPRTLLVTGTAGVRAKPSRCQIAAYRLPATGAVVVIVGWSSLTAAGGGPLEPGRAALKKLETVSKPSFECFGGRGAVADVLLGGKAYQVNVLVGERASKHRVEQALAVARSFDRTHMPA
jgi:hypothetical protein